ncbi:MAG: hypothetical protein AB1648_13880 [Pseudomonadota bacterium]
MFRTSAPAAGYYWALGWSQGEIQGARTRQDRRRRAADAFSLGISAQAAWFLIASLSFVLTVDGEINMKRNRVQAFIAGAAFVFSSVAAAEGEASAPSVAGTVWNAKMNTKIEATTVSSCKKQRHYSNESHGLPFVLSFKDDSNFEMRFDDSCISAVREGTYTQKDNSIYLSLPENDLGYVMNHYCGARPVLKQIAKVTNKLKKTSATLVEPPQGEFLSNGGLLVMTEKLEYWNVTPKNPKPKPDCYAVFKMTNEYSAIRQ